MKTLITKIKNFLTTPQDKNEFQYFFEEVSYDIERIKELNAQEYEMSLGIQPSDEFHEEDLNRLKKKYENEYCPCQQFKRFSQKDKMNYLVLRTEIDKQLEIKNTKYQL